MTRQDKPIPVYQKVELRLKGLAESWLKESGRPGAVLYGEDQQFLVTSEPERRIKARLAFVEQPLTEREHSSIGAIPRIPVWIAECLQPRTTIGQVSGQVKAAHAAGVKCVWILDPWSRSVEEHRPDHAVTMRTRDQVFECEACPGLHISVDELFAGIAEEESAEKLWIDCLHEKHECYASGHIEVRECLIGEEPVQFRVWGSLPVFQSVTGAIRGPLLFLCGSTDEEFDDKSCGAILVGRRADDGIYDVHVWHELFPWAGEHLGINR